MRFTLSSKFDSRMGLLPSPGFKGAAGTGVAACAPFGVPLALCVLAYCRSHSSCEAKPMLGLGDAAVAVGATFCLANLAVSADD